MRSPAVIPADIAHECNQEHNAANVPSACSIEAETGMSSVLPDCLRRVLADMSHATKAAIGLTAFSLILITMLYPISLYIFLPFPNGGPLGLLFTLLAAAAAWAAMFVNRKGRFVRWFVQGAFAALVSLVLIHEIANQYLSGWRHW